MILNMTGTLPNGDQLGFGDRTSSMVGVGQTEYMIVGYDTE